MATSPNPSLQQTMTIYEADKALSFVDTSDRDLWVRMGAALKTEFGEEGKNTWLNWSQQDPSFNAKDANSVWKSIKPGRIGIGSLIYEAKRYGYRPERNNERPRLSPQELAKREAVRKMAEQQAIIERMNEAQEAKEKAQALYAKGHQVNPTHPYLVKKGITDPDSLKSIKQLGKNLLIPAYQNKELVAVQRINPDGGKYFGKGEQLSGSSLFIGRWSEVKEKGLLMAEGFATVASLREATGKPVLITFNAHNMVAMAERLKDQAIRITLCADNDSHSKSTGLIYAQKAAEILGNKAKVIMPEFTEDDVAHYQAKHGQGKYPTDFNDLHELRGLEAVKRYLEGEIDMTLEKTNTTHQSILSPSIQGPSLNPQQKDAEENGIFFDYEQSQIKAPKEQESIIKKATDIESAHTPTPHATLTQETSTSSVMPKELEEYYKQKYILDHNYKRPPEHLEGRYYASGEYYFDAQTNTSIFMDKGNKLTTAKSDIQTVHDMMEVAKEKGWDNISLKGSKEFKRLAFLEAESQGISTTGYTPTKEDLAVLEHLRTSRTLNKIESVTPKVNNQPQVDNQPKIDTQAKMDNQQNAALADKEASRLVANNEIPTVGIIDESVVADTDKLVSTQEIGGAEIEPDLLAMANRLRDAGKHLNPPDIKTLNQHIKVAVSILNGMQKEFKMHAMRNFEENLSKSIQGDKLNIPNPLKSLSTEKSREQQQQREKTPVMVM